LTRYDCKKILAALFLIQFLVGVMVSKWYIFNGFDTVAKGASSTVAVAYGSSMFWVCLTTFGIGVALPLIMAFIYWAEGWTEGGTAYWPFAGYALLETGFLVDVLFASGVVGEAGTSVIAV
jgi:hypothetical protein